MRLEFDLYSLSEPKGWEHVLIVAVAIACLAASVCLMRLTLIDGTPVRRALRFLRSFVVTIVLLLTWEAVKGVYRTITRAKQKEIAAWIDGKQYEVASGPITQLVLPQKFWKSDPLPSFAVGEVSFVYGIYSGNEELKSYLDGGPLEEGRQVSIWHHDGRILRLYADDAAEKE